jgi:hypothetical protein
MIVAGALETLRLSWIVLVASKVVDLLAETLSGDASPERSSAHVGAAAAADIYARVLAAFPT